ncbi:MAG TPA: FHA domain-containing protein, partial [Bryobacteraceae bacterium]|nr:FHA domain-containing protein [Bryobacteraceae bacterium]
MAALYAIAGPLRGAVFQLGAEEVLIGRLSTSHLCIGDPSVSRRHCVIQPEGPRFRIRDLNSNNGTFVNGTRVDEQVLRKGDSIGVGDTLFQFVEKPADAADGGLVLADNGIVAHSAVRWQASDLEKTATVRTPGSAAQSGDLGRWARSLLQIGAALNNLQELAEIEDQLLKQILQIVPAEQAAIVLLPANGAGELSVTGRDRRHGKGAPVAVSRALVM